MTVALCLFGGAAVADVALSNPSFDEIADARAVGWELASDYRAERGSGVNGSGGIVWESGKPSRQGNAVQVVTGWKPGEAYVFSVSARTENFKGRTAACLEWYDAGGKLLGGAYASDVAVANADWFSIGHMSRPLPDKAATLKFIVYVKAGSTGKVSFDNALVMPLKREKVGPMVSSVYRDAAAGGAVTFHAFVNPQEVKGAWTAVCCWTNASGAACCAKADGCAPDHATLTLDVGQLAVGTQRIGCEILAADTGKPVGRTSLAFTRLETPARPRVSIDEHHRCIVDGRPFFPLGMYCTGINRPNLAAYAKGPFNCILQYNNVTRHQLDLCAEHGLMAFGSFFLVIPGTSEAKRMKLGTPEEVDAYVVSEIAKLRDHPALLAWYVNDEAPVMQVPARTHLYDVIKANDPDHPTYAVLCEMDKIRAFMPTCDVLGIDVYPVAQRPLRQVDEKFAVSKVAALGTRAFWNVLQAIDWGWYRKHEAAKERFPTVEELRSMNWQHSAGGANGLISYCVHALLAHKDTYDDYFGRVAAAAAEVKKMIPVILSVEPTPAVTSSTDDLRVRAWAKDGSLYVLACNLTPSPLKGSVRIADGAWTLAGVEVGPAAASMSDGKALDFELSPIGVSLVKLTRKD